MQIFKRVACAALAAVMLLGGCAQSDRSWVYRSGDVQPPAGVYLYYLISASRSASSKLYEADSSISIDSYKDLLAMTLDDQPVSQWMAAEAKEQLRAYIAIEQKFAEYGLSLSDQDQATVRSNLDSDWSYNQEYYEKNGIAKSSLQMVLENTLKRNAIFFHLYGEGGELAVSGQEIQDHFQNNFARVGHMLFYKAGADMTDENGETVTVEEQDAATLEEAEDYAERLRGGVSIANLIHEQRKKDEGESAAMPDAGDYELIVSQSLTSYYSQDLIDGALAMAVGDVAVVEDTYYYYVLQKYDPLEDPQDLANYRDFIVDELRSDEFEEMRDGWTAAVELEANKDAVDHYQPSRLKFDE